MFAWLTWAGVKGLFGTALAFVTGAKTWIFLGAAGAAAGFVLYLWIDNGRLEAQRNLARTEAMDAKVILNAFIVDNAFTTMLVAERDGKISELKEKHDALVQKIRQQPVTRACAGSPAFRVLLDGLREPGKGKAR